jgi:hypothetical protein
LQIQDLKVLFQLARMEKIGNQLWVIAGAISLDLLDNESGVSFHEELSDPQRQGCTQPKEQGLILCHVVGCLEVEVHHVLNLVSMRSEEYYPTLAPCLRKELPKKRVQWGPVKNGALGFGSLSSDPPGGAC